MSTDGAGALALLNLRTLRALPLSGAAKGVLWVLVSRADAKGEAYPSHATLAAEAGFSASTVRASLKSLSVAGLVSWRHRKGKRENLTSNVYRLTLPTHDEGKSWRPPPALLSDKQARRILTPERVRDLSEALGWWRANGASVPRLETISDYREALGGLVSRPDLVVLASELDLSLRNAQNPNHQGGSELWARLYAVLRWQWGGLGSDTLHQADPCSPWTIGAYFIGRGVEAADSFTGKADRGEALFEELGVTAQHLTLRTPPGGWPELPGVKAVQATNRTELRGWTGDKRIPRAKLLDWLPLILADYGLGAAPRTTKILLTWDADVAARLSSWRAALDEWKAQGQDPPQKPACPFKGDLIADLRAHLERSGLISRQASP